MCIRDRWYSLLHKALYMDTLIKTHKGIMQRYDPQGRIGLLVDEWGAWHDVEPGTNPGFLYQQNTLRDAMVAAVTLNIFNKHSDRVRMANLAQTVNVLQSVVLTEGEQMLLTPTYHVFDLYSSHQDAMLADSFIQSEEEGEGAYRIPTLQESASVAEDGTLTVTLANLSLKKDYEIDAVLLGAPSGQIEATLLGGEMDACNTFEQPQQVQPEDFSNQVRPTASGAAFTIPAHSIVKLSIRP